MADSGFQGYNSDRPYSVPSGISGIADTDISTDPAGHTFLSTDSRRHGDLKEMLDGKKDSLKLEAMKRIVTMVARGRDASDLFPAVVKNVITKDPEIKKLVYVYLARYAEEQQDLALLSISSFQRALKDPNPLIRANALRVLCGIRVAMVIPIMMLALKEAVNDMSPYVRKAAANAIPKLLSLDPDLRDQLIDIIQKLIADRTTLVVGSAIVAFEEVCPERIDLVHKNYRKLCNMVVDVDEWGQVVIINMLARYARMQFVDPNQGEQPEVVNDEEPFYASSSSDEEGNPKPESDRRKKAKKKPFYMDPDHRLLLRNTRPLLQSRNAAVVMAVAQLYFYCSPANEVAVVARSLVRLLRSHREIQYIVLSNIAAMSVNRRTLFEPHLKSFFIRSSDPSYVKLLKLEILTSLANETNVSGLLREFQTYVSGSDKDFAAATIQAIGRCAANIDSVTDTCLAGLVNLMSKRNEVVVAESVVVIRKLLQLRPSQCQDIITQMARLVEKISVPMARASILWLIGEYSQHVPKIAPDVLRILAKSFVNEEEAVKLQIINLAAKLIIVNPKQTRLLAQYVFNLAKYDQSYDIRDRARMLRCMVLPSPASQQVNGVEDGPKPAVNVCSKSAKKILLATKPAPLLETKLKEMNKFRLGTLSQLIATQAEGYEELPEWPTVAPDPTVRNVEIPKAETGSVFVSKSRKTKGPPKKEKSFYSDEEDEDEEDIDDEEEDEEEAEDEEYDEDEEDDEDDDEDEDDEEEEEENELPVKSKVAAGRSIKKVVESEEDEDEDEEDEDEDEEDEDEDDEDDDEYEDEEPPFGKRPSPQPAPPKKQTKPVKSKSQPKKQQQDLLLDLDFGEEALPPVSAPVMAASQPGSGLNIAPQSANVGPVFQAPFNRQPRRVEVIDRVSGSGLVASYCFPRTISVFQPRMVTVQMNFVNNSPDSISKLRVVEERLSGDQSIQDFGTIETVTPGPSGAVSVLMSIDFRDSLQPVSFVLGAGLDKTWSVSITPTVGELLQPLTSMTTTQFQAHKKQLAGMNENSASLQLSKSLSDENICLAVFDIANVVQIPSSESGQFWFAGQTSCDRSVVLVSLIPSDGNSIKVTVNCDKMVVGNMLLKEVQKALSS